MYYDRIGITNKINYQLIQYLNLKHSMNLVIVRNIIWFQLALDIENVVFHLLSLLDTQKNVNTNSMYF